MDAACVSRLHNGGILLLPLPRQRREIRPRSGENEVPAQCDRCDTSHECALIELGRRKGEDLLLSKYSKLLGHSTQAKYTNR